LALRAFILKPLARLGSVRSACAFDSELLDTVVATKVRELPTCPGTWANLEQALADLDTDNIISDMES
jgi:hypothetical protein